MAQQSVLERIRQVWVTWRLRLVVALIVMAVAGALVWVGYGQPWTGFGGYTNAEGEWQSGKTLWDWLELLLVPAVLALGAVGFAWLASEMVYEAGTRRDQRERELELDRLRQAALQAYLDRMAELPRGVDPSQEDLFTRDVARARTLAVLRQLDAERKGLLLQFIQDSGLIGKETPFLTLNRADLREANLRRANLGEANLRRANLRRANLEGVELAGADLRQASLREARLHFAGLKGANLVGANLTGANLTGANLREANLSWANLSGANLSGVELVSAVLVGTILVGTNLSRADLRWANLREADLEGATVTEAQLGRATTIEDAIMPDGTKHD